MMGGSLLALALMPAWRIVYSGAVLRSLGLRKILFLGDHPLSRQLAERIQEQPEFGMTAAGYLAAADAEGEGSQAIGRRLGSPDNLLDVVGREKPDLIVTGMAERRGNLPVYDLLELRLRGTMIEDSAVLYERIFGRVSVQTLRPSQLVFSSSLGPNPQFVALQSLYSTGLAAVGTLLTLPVMAVVAALVKLTSKGPVIYRQRRVGLLGREFHVYKFRSMYADAEANTGAVWASKNDPRITPLGRWLRRLRLDELPQFFNVLKGDMALVGPRPERPEFVQTLSEQIPFYQHRHCVKPGVTGWAQINHKYGDTIEDTITKLEYDLYYIKNLSPALDALIMFHTLKVMLLRRGSQ
jgi:sugar transferase (PEP-CTERM system associated)